MKSGALHCVAVKDMDLLLAGTSDFNVEERMLPLQMKKTPLDERGRRPTQPDPFQFEIQRLDAYPVDSPPDSIWRATVAEETTNNWFSAMGSLLGATCNLGVGLARGGRCNNVSFLEEGDDVGYDDAKDGNPEGPVNVVEKTKVKAKEEETFYLDIDDGIFGSEIDEEENEDDEEVYDTYSDVEGGILVTADTTEKSVVSSDFCSRNLASILVFLAIFGLAVLIAGVVLIILIFKYA